jgi:hypothetical protein
MYLAVATRPDIACAVATCARYMTNPGQEHWTALKRIFRYLSGSSAKGLVYNCSTECDTLECHSDSDWAAEQNNRRSTTGFVVYLYGCLISWKSRLQQTVAHSSTEAEYMAMSDTAREVMWIRGLLQQLGLALKNETHIIHSKRKERDAAKLQAERKYKPYLSSGEAQANTPTVMNADNQGAIHLSKNPVNHDRTKHIDVKYHYIREKVEENHILPQYINTKLNDADIFTKTTCTTEDFVSCRERVMGYDQRALIERQALRFQVQNASLEEKMHAAKQLKSCKAKKKKGQERKKVCQVCRLAVVGQLM